MKILVALFFINAGLSNAGLDLGINYFENAASDGTGQMDFSDQLPYWPISNVSKHIENGKFYSC